MKEKNIEKIGSEVQKMKMVKGGQGIEEGMEREWKKMRGKNVEEDEDEGENVKGRKVII